MIFLSHISTYVYYINRRRRRPTTSLLSRGRATDSPLHGARRHEFYSVRCNLRRGYDDDDDDDFDCLVANGREGRASRP